MSVTVLDELPESYEEADYLLDTVSAKYFVTVSSTSAGRSQFRRILCVYKPGGIYQYIKVIRAIFARNLYTGTIYALVRGDYFWGCCTYAKPEVLRDHINPNQFLWIGDDLHDEFNCGGESIYKHWIGKLTCP
jgi:hypothetical protein